MRLTFPSGLLRSMAGTLGGLMLGMGVTFAGPTCTDKPQSAWRDAAKFQSELKSQGYVIDKFKTTKGNCYEIYGKDAAGKKVEIYFDPTSGKIVKEERR
jgi:hypothetical protein